MWGESQAHLPHTYLMISIYVTHSSAAPVRNQAIFHTKPIQRLVFRKKNITPCLLLIMFFFNQALSQSNAFSPKFLHIPKYHTGMWIQQHFVLSYPFPSFICGRRFLLGKTGIVKQLSITLLLCFARLSILILVSPQLIPLHQETQARTFCTVCSSHWYPAAFQYCASCFASQERKKMFLFITIIVKTARNSFADCKIYSL